MTHRNIAPAPAPAPVPAVGRSRSAITHLVRTGACGLAALLALAACDQPTVAPAASQQAPATSVSLSRQRDGNSGDVDPGRSGNPAQVNRELAALRRLTAPFHNIQTAEAAGWSVQLTGCMENPPAGGMGYHYANTSYIDGTAEVLKPQLLLYEPEKNGRMRLVAVEYIIPYSFIPETAPAPMLYGQAFHKNPAFQLWGLHAWVWEHNPSGMFADWNPRVNCKYAK